VPRIRRECHALIGRHRCFVQPRLSQMVAAASLQSTVDRPLQWSSRCPEMVRWQLLSHVPQLLRQGYEALHEEEEGSQTLQAPKSGVSLCWATVLASSLSWKVSLHFEAKW